MISLKFLLYDMEVCLVQICQGYILQKHCVVCINGDQDIATRCCRSSKSGRRIYKITIPEFEQVTAHREIGNDILAKIGAENEGVVTRAAGHRVIACATGDGVVPWRAGDRIISASTAYRCIGIDCR